jgi:hypothetical protein
MSARELLLAVDHVVPHTDADGLAAGALALRARGETAQDALLLGRGATPFGPQPPLPSGSLAVLDWGVREVDRPAIFVDHHAPEAEPRPDQIVVSGYGETRETSTAALVRRLLPEGGRRGSPPSARSAISATTRSRSQSASAPRAAPCAGSSRS